MTDEPPEGPSPEDDEGPDWEEMGRNAARDFIADRTPDMQEVIDNLRDEVGQDKLDEMVAEVLRRAHQLDDEEQFEALDDDILLDRLGGASGDVPGEERSELTDLLGAWRDDVESEPVPPIAERAQQIYEFSKEIERATRPPQEGTPVSVSENAARLNQLAANCTGIRGVIAEADNQLTDLMTQAMAALGDVQMAQEVNASGAMAQQVLHDAQDAMASLGQVLENVAARLMSAGS